MGTCDTVFWIGVPGTQKVSRILLCTTSGTFCSAAVPAGCPVGVPPTAPSLDPIVIKEYPHCAPVGSAIPAPRRHLNRVGNSADLTRESGMPETTFPKRFLKHMIDRMRLLLQSRRAVPRVTDPLHSDIPAVRNAEIAAIYRGQRVAGDFYEFLRVNRSRVLFGLFDIARS